MNITTGNKTCLVGRYYNRNAFLQPLNHHFTNYFVYSIAKRDGTTLTNILRVDAGFWGLDKYQFD
jgi:hypothetical protein